MIVSCYFKLRLIDIESLIVMNDVVNSCVCCVYEWCLCEKCV